MYERPPLHVEIAQCEARLVPLKAEIRRKRRAGEDPTDSEWAEYRSLLGRVSVLKIALSLTKTSQPATADAPPTGGSVAAGVSAPTGEAA